MLLQVEESLIFHFIYMCHIFICANMAHVYIYMACIYIWHMYIGHIFFVCVSIGGQEAVSYILTIVSDAARNMEYQTSLQCSDVVSSGYIARNAFAGSYVTSLF